MPGLLRLPTGVTPCFTARDGEDVRHQVVDTDEFPTAADQAKKSFLQDLIGCIARSQVNAQVVMAAAGTAIVKLGKCFLVSLSQPLCQLVHHTSARLPIVETLQGLWFYC